MPPTMPYDPAWPNPTEGTKPLDTRRPLCMPIAIRYRGIGDLLVAPVGYESCG